jgi:hypothetical protein
MNFHLKLYHWAIEASYKYWQITIYRLKSEYFYAVFHSYKYKKIKMKQKCWFLEKSSLNWVFTDAYQLYTVQRPLRSCQKYVRIKIDINLRFEWCVISHLSDLGTYLWNCALYCSAVSAVTTNLMDRKQKL